MATFGRKTYRSLIALIKRRTLAAPVFPPNARRLILVILLVLSRSSTGEAFPTVRRASFSFFLINNISSAPRVRPSFLPNFRVFF